MSKFNPMISVSLIFAMLVMLGVIYFSFLAPTRSAQTIKLATGEWAPFTGENLESKGIVTAIVTHILDQMGYRAEYEFMPWELSKTLVAGNQRNEGVRGTFPYIKTAQRKKNFYFSQKLIDIDYAIFYHEKHNPNAAKIVKKTHLPKLSEHRILALQGYDYHPDIKAYLPKEPCRKNALDAFRHLANPRPMVWLYSKSIDPSYFALRKKAGQKKTDQAFVPHKTKLQFSQLQTSSAAVDREAEYFVYSIDDLTASQAGPFSEEKLKKYDVLVVKGDIDGELIKLIRSIPTDVCQIEKWENAVQTLDFSRKPAVVIEALDVGRQLLSQQLPQLLPVIHRAEYLLKVEHAVMFSRNNPDNLALRDEFDRHLGELQANSNAYDFIINNTKTRIDLARAVHIEPFAKQDLVAAYVYDEKEPQCSKNDKRVFLPRGSKALMSEWHKVFLQYQQPLKEPLVKIRLLNGPLASTGDPLCVDGRSIVLP